MEIIGKYNNTIARRNAIFAPIQKLIFTPAAPKMHNRRLMLDRALFELVLFGRAAIPAKTGDRSIQNNDQVK